MTRQLIVCCDGTNKNLSGGARDTHVVRLVELLARDPDAERLVFYDPGVGHAATLPGGTLWEQFKLLRTRMQGLAFGQGLFENMIECLQFLMANYRDGDELYFFGFSRGAFTVRSVAGLVSQFGIPQAHQGSMLPTLLHLYFAKRLDLQQFDRVSLQAQQLFVDPPRRRIPIHFVGVWDTVAAVGLWPFELRFSARPLAAGKAFVHVRQALALDEHRAPFEPRLYEDANGPIRSRDGRLGSVEQRWFRGSHADVGGGYEQHEAAAAQAPLAWMLDQACQCGLRLRVAGERPPSETAWLQLLDDDRAKPGPLRLHNALANQSVWALAGQRLRQTRAGAEHASVAEQPLQWENHGAWATPRSRRMFWACAALLPLLWLWMGVLLTGFGRGGAVGSLDAFARFWPQILAAPTQFALGQLSLGAWGAVLPLGQAAPLWALVIELGFIAAYAVVLARLCARGFARVGGLRRFGDPPRPLLNQLGRALPLLLLADLAETLLTALGLLAGRAGSPGLATLLAALTVPAAAAKFAGLAGSLALAARALR